MKVSRRNFLVSLLVAACILFPGAFLFRNSEAGTELIVVASFAIGQASLFVLDGRESRRNGRKD